LRIYILFLQTGETERTELKYLEKEHLKQFEVYLSYFNFSSPSWKVQL